MRIARACLAALLLAAAVAFGALNAHAAAGLDDALTQFTTDDFSDTNDAINAVVSSGSPRAEAIIRALQDGRLMFSAERKAVYIKDNADKLTDAATGQPITGDAPADLDTVRLNNRLRGTIDAAIGGLTLLSADPVKRLGAAEAVFKSREAGALPNLEAAIAKEQDARIKRVLMQARAAIVLNSDDATDADRLAAIEVIRQRGDQDALGLLYEPAGRRPRRRWAKAAAAAMAGMQNRLVVWDAVQNAWYGVSLGRCCCSPPSGLPSRSA